MRVTHVITRLIVGGAQENTIASVLGLRRKQGMEVDLISGPSLGAEGSLESELGVAREAVNTAGSPLTIVPELVRPINPWKDFIALRRLTRRFRERKPDIVHTHSGKAGVLGRLAARRAGVRVIVHTIHGPSFGAFQSALPNALFQAAERRAGRVTTHFVVVADAMKEQYLAAGIGRPEQYTRIYSGFDLGPFLKVENDPQCRARLGFAPGDIVVGKIARLFKLKGHADLIAAAPELVRRCPRMRFLLVGDGELTGRFVVMTRAMGLRKHFVFTGLVPPAEVPALVGIMDVVVHLSRREGLPRALPQALAAARPVVAYDCDGAREVCLDNKTGFLVRPGDLPGLREGLIRLAGNPELRRRFGEKGREFVRDRFPVERMVESLYALYQELLSENQRLPAD